MSGGSDPSACSKQGHSHSQAAVLLYFTCPVSCFDFPGLWQAVLETQMKPGQTILVHWFPFSHRTTLSPQEALRFLRHNLPPVSLCWLSPRAASPSQAWLSAGLAPSPPWDPRWFCLSCGPRVSPLSHARTGHALPLLRPLGLAQLLAPPGRAGEWGLQQHLWVRPIRCAITQCSPAQFLAASFLFSN